MSSVVVFSGGRGSSTISKAALNTPGVELSVLVNGYDDGLSTGVIRRLFPGSLGPSDFRKVVSNLSLDRGTTGGAISRLLEFRSSPSDISKIQSGKVASDIDGLREICFDLPLRVVKEVNDSLSTSLLSPQCMDVNPKNWEEMAIGNLIIAGIFAQSNSDFNHAINRFNKIFLPEVNLQNVTNGENLVLVALKANGDFLHDEAAIVGVQNDSPLLDIYLLRDYFAPDEFDEFQSLSLSEKKRTLEGNEVFPQPNSEAITAIKSADAIIYGPGTQHSSLFPSYLTFGIGEAVASNMRASKVLVANLSPDHDIGSESMPSLFLKFGNYLNRKRNLGFLNSELATNLLIQKDSPLMGAPSDEELRHFSARLRQNNVDVSLFEWSSSPEKHDGEHIVQTALSFSKVNAINSHLTRVSIIVPVLNEAGRCGQSLDSLVSLNWLRFGLLPEFIVVDGGSSDSSVEECEQRLGVKVIQYSSHNDRGKAINHGISSASNNLVAIYPADGEYFAEDLIPIFDLLVRGRTPVVFGSRNGFSGDNRENLGKTYDGKPYVRLMSRFGGLLLQLIILLRHRRTVSDPLTSVKGFQKNALDAFSFGGVGLRWHIRLVADAAIHGIPITEVPVGYQPRHQRDGKKTTLRDGLLACIEAMR